MSERALDPVTLLVAVGVGAVVGYASWIVLGVATGALLVALERYGAYRVARALTHAVLAIVGFALGLALALTLSAVALSMLPARERLLEALLWTAAMVAVCWLSLHELRDSHRRLLRATGRVVGFHVMRGAAWLAVAVVASGALVASVALVVRSAAAVF